ncbi:unnamed protein product [Schistosoma haematobium]|nr:unnamed protein product [Schistosoma haematobium]
MSEVTEIVLPEHSFSVFFYFTVNIESNVIRNWIINQQTYRWNEFSNPTALNESIQLRHIRHIHDHNNAMDNDNNNNVQLAENILYQTNDNSAIDMITFNTDRRKSRMRYTF